MKTENPKIEVENNNDSTKEYFNMKLPVNLKERCSPVKMDDGRVLKCQLFSTDKKGNIYAVYHFPEIKTKEDYKLLPEFKSKKDYTLLHEKEIIRLRENYLNNHYEDEQELLIDDKVFKTRKKCWEKIQRIKKQYDKACKYANGWRPLNSFFLDSLSVEFAGYYHQEIKKQYPYIDKTFSCLDDIVEYFFENQYEKSEYTTASKDQKKDVRDKILDMLLEQYPPITESKKFIEKNPDFAEKITYWEQLLEKNVFQLESMLFLNETDEENPALILSVNLNDKNEMDLLMNTFHRKFIDKEGECGGMSEILARAKIEIEKFKESKSLVKLKTTDAPKTMKAISLQDYNDTDEAYATLVETGAKWVETRTWKTNFRGDILICCSKSSKSDNAGLAVCVVEVYDVVEMKPEHALAAKCDYVEGKYAWLLRNHRKLSEKFPVKGAQSIYNVELPENIQFIQTGKF